ncbi:MAG TPA: hypothetical protein VGK35_07025 [Actinotalea sp.]|jgi:hypothetical protein
MVIAAARFVRTHPWLTLAVGVAVAVVGSVVRDLIHRAGTLSAGEVVDIVVTTVGGILATWALVVIALRRRAVAMQAADAAMNAATNAD